MKIKPEEKLYTHEEVMEYMNKLIDRKPTLLEIYVIFPFKRLCWTLSELPRNTKYAYQRIKKGFSDIDKINANTFLSLVISDITKELSEKHMGIPSRIYEKYRTKELHEADPVAQEKAEEEWKHILNTISIGFKHKALILGDVPDLDNKVVYPDIELAFKYFKEYFDELWD